MARRTGVPSILLAAEKLCKLIADWGPFIKNLYPDNTTLKNAIDAANTACDALATELRAVREYGD